MALFFLQIEKTQSEQDKLSNPNSHLSQQGRPMMDKKSRPSCQ
jgi:hypothetical protein